mgnify:CR=1 FL=1
MKRAIAFLLVLLGFACSSQDKPIHESEIVKKEPSEKVAIDFDLSLGITNLVDNSYNMSVNLDLEPGAYVVSPYSEDTTYMHFNMFFPETNMLKANSDLLEEPRSVEEFDPILARKVRFIREKTTFQKKLTVLTTSDFEIEGRITFMIEPRCVPYDVVFSLKQSQGKLSIKQTEIAIASSYYPNRFPKQ